MLSTDLKAKADKINNERHNKFAKDIVNFVVEKIVSYADAGEYSARVELPEKWDKVSAEIAALSLRDPPYGLKVSVSVEREAGTNDYDNSRVVVIFVSWSGIE